MHPNNNEQNRDVDSLCQYRLDVFLDMYAKNNLHVDAFSWHEFGSPDDIIAHVAHVKRLFKEKYSTTSVCRPSCPEIHINEFQGGETFFEPGWVLGYLEALEKSNVDFVAKACWWDVPTIEGKELYNACATGLDGLLYIDGKTPEPAYWLYKNYVGSFADRARLVTTSSEPKIVTLASKNDITHQIELMIGRYDGLYSDVTLTIANYPYEKNELILNIQKIPALPFPPLRPLAQPVTINPQILHVQDGSVSFVLPDFKSGDAYMLRIQRK